MSRERVPRVGCPPPEGVDVAYPPGVRPQGQSEEPSYDHRLPTGAAGPRIIEDPNMNRPAPVLAVAWTWRAPWGGRGGGRPSLPIQAGGRKAVPNGERDPAVARCTAPVSLARAPLRSSRKYRHDSLHVERGDRLLHTLSAAPGRPWPGGRPCGPAGFAQPRRGPG